jgi:hypothetical protein
MAEKVRLGLIGASVSGTWSSRSHLPALRASGDVELTAVCTTRADSAEAARQAWGARLAFDDWRRMVASPEIDAVAIVVRVPSHYPPARAALEAGKHVYCEWPLGRTTAEAVELATLAKACDGRAAEAHNADRAKPAADAYGSAHHPSGHGEPSGLAGMRAGVAADRALQIVDRRVELRVLVGADDQRLDRVLAGVVARQRSRRRRA